MVLNDEGGGMRTTSGGSGGGLARFLPWGSAPGGSSGPVGIMEAGLLPKPVQAPPPKYWLEARKEDAEVSEPARKAAVPLQKRRSHDTSGSPAQELAAGAQRREISNIKPLRQGHRSSVCALAPTTCGRWEERTDVEALLSIKK